MVNKYALRNIWVVDNIGRGYIIEIIKRKINEHKDGDYVLYKNKQYKISYYQPGKRKRDNYCIFPQGLPKTLKESGVKYWHKSVRL